MADESQKLKEYTNNLNLIMKYNDNDMNRAKKILDGSLKDFIAIKGKLISEKKQTGGLFLVILHKYKYYLVDKFSVVKNSLSIINTVNVTDSWKVFFSEINASIEKNDYLKEDVSNLNIAFEKEFRPAIISQMIEKLENKDLTSVTIQLEKMCSFAIGNNDFLLQIDFENMTSLEYEDNIKKAISDKKAIDDELKAQDSQKALSDAAMSNDPIEIERNKLLAAGSIFVRAEVSLSPVKGKFISELLLGDIIGIRITEKSPKAANIINQLNLVSADGKIKKVKGKIIFAKKTEKGFLQFIQIAPLIIAETLDEEEMKIEYFPVGGEGQKKQKSKNAGLQLIILSSVFTAIVLTVLFVLLF